MVRVGKIFWVMAGFFIYQYNGPFGMGGNGWKMFWVGLLMLYCYRFKDTLIEAKQ